MELSERIRALRKARGLSQEALAQELDVSRQAITKWEDGSSLPSTANLFALCGFFGITLEQLTSPSDDVLPSAAQSASGDEPTQNPTMQATPPSPEKLRRMRFAALGVSVVCLALMAAAIVSTLPSVAVGHSVGIIGGADGPTAIFVTSSPDAATWLLILLLLPILFGSLAFYLGLRFRQGKAHIVNHILKVLVFVLVCCLGFALGTWLLLPFHVWSFLLFLALCYLLGNIVYAVMRRIDSLFPPKK